MRSCLAQVIDYANLNWIRNWCYCYVIGCTCCELLDKEPTFACTCAISEAMRQNCTWHLRTDYNFAQVIDMKMKGAIQFMGIWCNQTVQHCWFKILLISASLNRNKEVVGKTVMLNQQCRRVQPSLRPASFSWQKHSRTIFAIEILIKMLAASSCMIDFFCKSMAASNFCDDRKSALSGKDFIFR